MKTAFGLPGLVLAPIVHAYAKGDGRMTLRRRTGSEIMG